MVEISDGWFVHNDSDLVVVFVHGIFSDSDKCWRDEKTKQFWPQLIVDDQRYKKPSIFLSGFYTAKDSNDYGVQNCAIEVLEQLKRQDADLNSPPLSKNNIIFVTHSTGGIVVRYLLEAYADDFVDKKIGLALYASPSYGSKLASAFGWAATLFNNKLAQELSWGSSILDDLDGRFRDLLESRKLNISGYEAYENRSPFHISLLNNSSKRVVEKQSAARYFGKPKLVPKSDHSSIVKPISKNDFSHNTLLDFMNKHDFINNEPGFNRNSDALFDHYDRCHDKFYVVRKYDDVISKTLMNYSLWVCGPTGVGKTVAIQRAISIRNIELKYISLGACINESMAFIFNDILAGLSREEDAEKLNVSEAIKSIANKIIVICKTDDFCLLIEEIPIKDQEMFIEFSEYIYTLLLHLKKVKNFRLVLSSIYEPADITGGELDKIFESFKIVRSKRWSLEDVNKLIDVIESEIVDVDSMKGQGEQFKGSPRETKIYYRDSIAQS